MKGFSKESKIGFAGTIIFHALLLLLALIFTLGNKTKSPDYVELSFTAIEQPPEEETVPMETVNKSESSSKSSSSVTSIPANKTAKSETVVKSAGEKSSMPRISPPRYSASMDNENVRFPDSKLDVADSRSGASGSLSGDSKISNNKETFSPGKSDSKISGDLSSSTSAVSSPGSGNIGKEIKGYSISWRDGGNRSKISGSLPRYPENSNKEVQIKVRISVTPDGSVNQITPLQKADFIFENAVITALKTWKFEKLKTAQPAENQTGIITFNFKLD